MKTRAYNEEKSLRAAIERPVDFEAGRRAFIRSAGLAAAGAAVLAGGVTLPVEAQAQGAPTDEQILNFALNLEYLEANFYLQAAFGRVLAFENTTGTGTRANVLGGRQVNFDTPLVREYAEEIAMDEEAHVLFLRSALGNMAVAQPRIDIRNSFRVAATAAGLIEAGENFDAYANENNFLLAAFIFEDVGVTAYKGAAPLIQNPGTLEAAAGILAVEAYHAGVIRAVLLSKGLFREANMISRARDSLDNVNENGDTEITDLDQGIRTTAGANVVPSDENGIAFSRTARQVLRIVYLDINKNQGGFFPNGANGAIS